MKERSIGILLLLAALGALVLVSLFIRLRLRESPLFTQWRAIVGPFFAAPPLVEHFTLLATSG